MAAIQDRYVKGRPLDVAGLDDIRLSNAAKRRFGSWQAAVEAAGLAGKIVIKKPQRRWSQETVISEIQSWHRSGRPFTDVRKNYQSLQCAAKTWFGSWRDALIAAGFESGRRAWTKQAIIDELHDRVRKGQSLSSGELANRNLAAVAFRHFGSWRKAIRAAGVLSHQADRKGA